MTPRSSASGRALTSEPFSRRAVSHHALLSFTHQLVLLSPFPTLVTSSAPESTSAPPSVHTVHTILRASFRTALEEVSTALLTWSSPRSRCPNLRRESNT